VSYCWTKSGILSIFRVPGVANSYSNTNFSLVNETSISLQDLNPNTESPSDRPRVKNDQDNYLQCQSTYAEPVFLQAGESSQDVPEITAKRWKCCSQ
jgi:hypothetical protein